MQPVHDVRKNLLLFLPGAVVITVMVYWLTPSGLRPLTTSFFAVICCGWLWKEDIKARRHAEAWALRVADRNRELAGLLQESLEQISGGRESPDTWQVDPGLPDRIRKSLEQDVEPEDEEELPPDNFRSSGWDEAVAEEGDRD